MILLVAVQHPLLEGWSSPGAGHSLPGSQVLQCSGQARCDGELLEANQMASTLKLLVLRAMDSLLDYPQGMERFLGWSKVRRLQNMRSWKLKILLYSLLFVRLVVN